MRREAEIMLIHTQPLKAVLPPKTRIPGRMSEENVAVSYTEGSLLNAFFGRGREDHLVQMMEEIL